jgi:Fe-S cluster assembly protein SufD
MAETQHYVKEFKAFEKNGGSKAPLWVKDIRNNALTIFSENGFPKSNEEDWRFTNILPISKTEFAYASDKLTSNVTSETIVSFMIQGVKQHTIVIVDGHFSKELSSIGLLPSGVILSSLADAFVNNAELVKEHLGKYVKMEHNAFTAMNTAFVSDGVFVFIPSGVEVAEPIHLIFVSTNSDSVQRVANSRNLIIVEENSSASFLSSFRSANENKNLTNVVTEIVARKQSKIVFVKAQKESDTTFHYENIYAHQYEQSNVELFSLALGSSIARNDISIIIDGEAAECNLNGLYIPTGEQLIDHHTLMHHIHPNCPSHELFKGILSDNSRAVFNGKVYVEPEAQKTDSKQTNRNLLLSDTATINTKPELEIFADDVKCTHGAAVGGMNQQSVFYLKSRGVSDQTSRGILIVGFAAEATEKISNAAIRHHIDLLVVDHLQTKLGHTHLPEIVHSH